MLMRAKLILCGLLFLILVAGIIWFFVYSNAHSGKLTVSFLNIGQGDAIFIESPTGIQVLIDGGPNASVLRELSAVMPSADRSIDMIAATHPDSDHISGLIDVLARYNVQKVLESSVKGDTPIWNSFRDAADKENAGRITALRGEVFNIGGGAYIEILFPDRDVSSVETNTGSIVAKLVYGNTSFLLTGDSPSPIEQYLVSLDRENLKSTVLKAGHHGSKNSTSPLYLGYVDPESVVFSRGCDNTYGHPAPETVALVAKFGESTYDTCTGGRVTFISDGTSVIRK